MGRWSGEAGQAIMYMRWGERCAGQVILCRGGGSAPLRRGWSGYHWGAVRRSGHHVIGGGVAQQSGKADQATMCWGGWCTGQARPVRPPCAGRGLHWSGEAGQATMCWGVMRQSGEAIRPPCAGEWCTGQATGLVRQSGEAGRATMCWGGGGGFASQARPPCARVVVRQSGKAGQATMCWGGGGCTSQARPVRPLCAGGVMRQSGEAIRPPCAGEWCTGQATGLVCQSGETGWATMCSGGGGGGGVVR